MPSKLFATQGDFSSRVTDTIVRYNGQFYWAMPSREQSFHVSLFTLPGVQVAFPAIHVDDEALDLAATKLGLFNYEGMALAVHRTPMRRYRYGTPPEYLSTSLPNGESGTYHSNLASGREYRTEGFIDMLYGRYPSVLEALTRIRASGGKNVVAVSRFFYLMEDKLGLTRLMFNGDCVLWVGPDGAINFVEKTTVNQYLSRCSKILNTITRDLREHRNAL